MTTVIEKEMQPDHEPSEGLEESGEAVVSPGSGKTKTQGKFFHVARHYEYDSHPGNAMAGISVSDWKGEMLRLLNRELKKGDVEYAAYIFHDRDVSPKTGALVPVHVHVLVRYKEVKAVSDVRAAFGVSRNKNGEVVDNQLGASRYLIHISDSAIREKKTIYSPDQVVTVGVDYRDMINDQWWEKKERKDLTKKAKATVVDGIPLMAVDTKEEAEWIYSYLSLLVLQGHMRPQAAMDAFLQEAGSHWYRKMSVDFTRDVEVRSRSLVERMTLDGRDLRNIYIFGAGGSGKSTLATKLGERLVKGGGLAVTAPLGKDKTFDALNDYMGERGIILNEMSAHAWTLDEYLACFDRGVYAPFPSRNANKAFVGDLCIFTNSITPMQFANDLLVYSKGGSQYQDPSNKRQIDKSNKDALDKYWQARRRMANIVALQRDELDNTLVNAHVFNLRYGRKDVETGEMNHDDGDHIYVGTVSFRSSPGSAPVITSDTLDKLERLIQTDLGGKCDEGETTIEEYLDRLGMTSKLSDAMLGDFIEQFVSECQWGFLPTPFLYDAYRAFHKRFYPKDSLMSVQEFAPALDEMLEDWERLPLPYRVKHLMDADEPLITEWSLVNWMNQNYQGSDPAKKRAFPRKDRYRGFVKK